MYYNENKYLNDDKKALDKIYNLRESTHYLAVLDSVKYQEIIKLYNEYIDIICKMLLSLGLHNSIDYSQCINYLVENSYLSYNEFEANDSPKFEIQSKPGVNIVLGNGCCRHYADLQKDIMNNLDLFCKKFYCYDSSTGSKLLAKVRQANHVINLIEYDDSIYGIDIFNNNLLYYFINESTLRSISCYNDNYLIYKPYIEIIFGESDIEKIKKTYEKFKKESNKNHMNYFDYDIIKFENKIFFDSINDVFNDFSNNTKEIKENIHARTLEFKKGRTL